MIIIENKFEFEQLVFLITDKDQLPRMVTRINVNKVNHVYELSQGSNFSWHFEYEITSEKNIMLSTSN